MSTNGQPEVRVLEMRPAAGGIRHDRLGAGRCEGGLGPACELEALLAASRMKRERAAAAGVRRRDLVPVRGEHAGRRAVHLAEQDRLHAPCEQAQAGDPLALGRRHGGRRHALAPAGGQLLQRLERPRSGERGEAKRELRPLRVREDREDERAQHPLARRARHLALDPLARELDQPVVLHTRRAGGEARHAAEAAVEVLGDRPVELERPLDRRLHQPDPAARGVHLLVPQLVRRAGREAEPAVDAVGDQPGVHQTRIPSGSKDARTRSASGDQRGSRGSAT